MPAPLLPLEDQPTSGTNAVTAKRELFRRLGLETGMAGVALGYAYSGKLDEANREYVYFGSTDITQDRRATGYVRDETATLDVVVKVRIPGADPYDAELRAQVLGSVLENLIGRNPNLDMAVPALIDYTVTGATLDSAIDDDSVVAQLVYKVAITSYLQ